MPELEGTFGSDVQAFSGIYYTAFGNPHVRDNKEFREILSMSLWRNQIKLQAREGSVSAWTEDCGHSRLRDTGVRTLEPGA